MSASGVETIDPTDDYPTGYVPPDLAALAADRAAVERDLGRRYEVVGFIARGGFASVWHATDRVTGSAVAVKRLDPRTGRGRDFYRELRAMFALDHPHVVRIVNILEAGGYQYLILEYCPGGNLRAAVSRGRRDDWPCPPGRAGEIVRQLADALAAAHRLGMTHRDLKPENVLFAAAADEPFGGTSAVKLADFGLARLLSPIDYAMALGGLTGSPAYMAPEQFAGTTTAASDVYSLGVIAYELLTGDLPFTGSPEELAYHHIRTMPVFPAGISGVWAELIPAMLSKVPAERPTAVAIADRLSPENVPAVAARPPRPSSGVGLTRVGAVSHLIGHAIGPEPQFLAVTPTSLDRLSADGVPVGSVPVTGVSGVFPGESGPVWLVAGDRVLRWDGPAADPVAVGPRPAGLAVQAVFDAGDGPRCAGFRGDAIELADPAPGRRVWAVTVPGGGLKRRLVRLAGSAGYAVTDFADGPGVRFLGPDGDDRGRTPLTGIAWQLLPWPGGGCVARVLTGHGFEAHLITPAGATRLKSSRGVAALAVGPAGVVGVWSDGAVMTWADDPRRPAPGPAVPHAGCRGVAVADGRAMALLDTDDGPAVYGWTMTP